MNVLVDRIHSDDDATISTVLVDGRFLCFGLEDEYREMKVAKETRIPAGIYRVGLQTFGYLHNKYSTRFADIHRGMLVLKDVPNFTGIMIHCGNTDEHTAGCLLVGEGATTTPYNFSISSSTAAYRRLYPALVDAAERNELMMTFLDTDRMEL